MARYVMIKRSSQVPMLLASDIDIREITSLCAEVIDILQQIFGARAVRVWRHPVTISSTAVYYALSLLSDKSSPGQGFCGIQMWFPMLSDSIQSRVTKFILYPSCSLPREELARLGERIMMVSISITEAFLPYLGFVVHRGVNAIKDLGSTVASDDSDIATAVARALNEEDGSNSLEEGDDDQGRQRLTATSRPSYAANRVSYTGVQRWLHDVSNSFRQCQSDPQYKWTSSVFTHGHLWFFLAYGVYFSPVLRAHAVRLIRACRVEKKTGTGPLRAKAGVADRINLKVLAWLVGGRLALLAFYGTYRWLHQRQGSETVLLANPIAAAGVSSLSPSRVRNGVPKSGEGQAEMDTGPGLTIDEPEAMPEMKDRSCPLCMDTIKHPVATRCGHLYCHTCLHDLLRRRGADYLQQNHALSGGSLCPVCRAIINVKELRHIYI